MIDPNRVTDRVNLSTLKLELKRARRPLAILAVGVAVAAAAGDYILNNINGGIAGSHTLQFEVADATGAVPGRGEARFYGVGAGQITNVRLLHGHAVLTATIANRFGPIYKNATAELRPNTALQDMYLDVVNRGTPGAGIARPNVVIPMNQTQSPVNLANVLNAFQPDVRTQLNNLLDQLGNGLQDRGQDLRQAFITLAPFLRIAGNLSHQLAVRATLTKQLVHNAATLSGVLASRSTQLHGLITNGTETLTALSTQGGAPLRATIDELPPALTSLQTLLNRVDSDVPQPATEAVAALRPVADHLPSALRNLNALASSADPAVRKLESPVTKLVPLADQLQPFARHLAVSLEEISPQVKDLNTATTDAAACTNEINEFLNWDASMAKFTDNLGPMTRGNFIFGFYSLPLFKDRHYTYRQPQCAGGAPIGSIPTPKYNGPPPAP